MRSPNPFSLRARGCAGSMLPFVSSFVSSCVLSLCVWAPEALAAPAAPDRFAQPGPWEQVSTQNGVVVQRRRFKGTGLHEFRGRGVVEAPIARVLAVLEEDAKRPSPTEKCDDAQRAADPNVKVAILYDRMKAPWPVSDRDAVLRADTLIDTTSHFVRIDFSSTSDLCVPLTKGVIRMAWVHGHYLLRPLKDGAHTDVEYQVQADPGGTLPGWAVNLTAKNLPMDTVSNLRKKAPSARYSAAAEAYLARPDYQALVAAPTPTPSPTAN